MNEDAGLLSIIRAEVEAASVSFGVTCGAELASSIVDRLALKLGGELLYVPVRSRIDRQKIHHLIRSEFDGTNALKLARKFNLSRRHIQRVLGGK